MGHTMAMVAVEPNEITTISTRLNNFFSSISTECTRFFPFLIMDAVGQSLFHMKTIDGHTVFKMAIIVSGVFILAFNSSANYEWLTKKFLFFGWNNTRFVRGGQVCVTTDGNCVNMRATTWHVFTAVVVLDGFVSFAQYISLFAFSFVLFLAGWLVCYDCEPN